MTTRKIQQEQPQTICNSPGLFRISKQRCVLTELSMLGKGMTMTVIVSYTHGSIFNQVWPKCISEGQVAGGWQDDSGPWSFTRLSRSIIPVPGISSEAHRPARRNLKSTWVRFRQFPGAGSTPSMTSTLPEEPETLLALHYSNPASLFWPDPSCTNSLFLD